MMMRLQKAIADSGLCSRRKAESLISDGRVTVNAMPVKLGESADPEKDIIAVDGRPISPEEKVYFALNKPPGYECSLNSTTGKPLATDIVKTDARIFPVGRLDADSRGLLFLTNDGDFANRIIHPHSSLEKEYLVKVSGKVSGTSVKRLADGILLGGRRTSPCIVSIKGHDRSSTDLVFVLHEGRKRQIRRMLEHLGLEVIDLARVRIGCITLEGLPEGSCRELTPMELKALEMGGGSATP
ncbi:MAG: pseudouridine synthase [Thermoplasmata archaeon]